jgi:hypothetical protein
MLNSSKKKVAESVYNMPTSSPSTQTYRSYFNDRRPSASSQQQKKSSSIKSIKTVSPILGMNLVDEPSSLSVTKERLPSVYPALISKVAEVFKECIILSTRTKDSITYKDVFDGKEAVVCIITSYEKKRKKKKV